MSQRKTLTNRTNNHHLARSSGNRPVRVLYSDPHCEPTPEGRADNGRVDGIAVRRLWQIERDSLRTLELIARMAQRI